MHDIFHNHNLFPYSGSILEHFQGLFDEVMIVPIPGVGVWDSISLLRIKEVFNFFGYKSILVMDEFYEYSIEVSLEDNSITKLTDEEKYIYSKDKELLVALGWNTNFFLIATKQNRMIKIIENKLFQGVLCDEQATLTSCMNLFNTN